MRRLFGVSGPAVVEVDGPGRRAHVPAACRVTASLRLPAVAAQVGHAAATGAVEGQVLTATPHAYAGTEVRAVDVGKP